MLYPSNVLSILDNGQKRIESYSALVFQWSGMNQRDSVVVRASASQSVDLEFISLVESYQQTFKKWYPQLPCLALGLYGMLWRASRQVRLLCRWARHLTGLPTFMWKTGAPDTSEKATPKRVRTYYPKA